MIQDMITITIDGEPLDLPAGFSAGVEDTSPIFNERGSRSLPATVPSTRHNERLLGFPSRLDTAVPHGVSGRVAEVADGPYRRRGLLNVTSAGADAGITFNVGFDNSTAYAGWSARRMRDLADLPVIRASVPELMEYMWTLYTAPIDEEDPLAVFPLAVGCTAAGSGDSETEYWEILNVPNPSASAKFRQPSRVKRVLDGEVTDVTVPDGYGLSPFVRVWRMVELVFADLGVEVPDNLFRTDPELRRLVVLNASADTVCAGTLAYAELMPDCTVAEFMQALWVRFGLVYDIDFDRRRATLRLIRDIITMPASIDLLPYTTGPATVTYGTPQYVKLSAARSLDGAATATERFEDFAAGHDLTRLRMGTGVGGWQFVDNGSGSGWDGDRGWGWVEDDPDPGIVPDPPEPDWDDYPDYSTAPGGGDSGEEPDNGATFLAREFITGTWFKLDGTNNSVRESSSGFFDWDPATPGLDPFDLSSVDECVPVRRVSNVGTGSGNTFNDFCPVFLVGARHFHSYVAGHIDDEADKDQTPLAFALAFHMGGTTHGRINAEGEDGKPVTLSDGSTPRLSLLFQFSDGLFARYWAGFDEILRHGGRTIELTARIPIPVLGAFDMTRPVTLRGVRCLPDTLGYSVPAGRKAETELKLRALTTQGAYDIAAEQGIPAFAAAARKLVWKLLSETFGDDLADDRTLRMAAANEYIEQTGYTPHGTDGDWYKVDLQGAIPVSVTRKVPEWQDDPALMPPTSQGAR
ncbi:MAG: hypothetical protein K2H87_01640, partial [Duncaniella sp.]|nr:hypothetical protein [Duncaniella sp.]